VTRQVTIVDSTLRDGSHAKRHQFTAEHVRAVAGALDRAGVPAIEISHGDGLGGSSYNYGFSLVDEYDLLAAAAEVVERARLAVLLIPGIGVKEDLERARELGASVVRVATHCTEADIAEAHLRHARALGYTAIGFLMMAHMTPPGKLADQARIMAGAGAEVVYVTDSAGTLLPHEAEARVTALRKALPDDVAIGFHGHQNLGLAVANSLAACRAGATWIDGCSFGMGAGAGNAPTELLAAAFAKAGIETGVDPFAALDVAADVVAPLLDRPQLIERESIVLGYAGVYSSFLLHARRAADRFGVSPTDILIEAGRRKTVGGQEDMLIEIAAALAGAPAQPGTA
jgi:4-hydroxy 2-oxovalerate aldolase